MMIFEKEYPPIEEKLEPTLLDYIETYSKSITSQSVKKKLGTLTLWIKRLPRIKVKDVDLNWITKFSSDAIIEDAESELKIISPYIKLHSRYKDVLKSKKGNDKIKISIVFGKNEKNKSKSLNQDDFEFLKSFPNIEIKYESRLHAKYYSNESNALLSSMNLYEYSQNNNIETGILTKTKLIGGILNNDTIDDDAYNYFNEVIENSEVLFSRKPKYKSQLMGLSKFNTHSDIDTDHLSP